MIISAIVLVISFFSPEVIGILGIITTIAAFFIGKRKAESNQEDFQDLIEEKEKSVKEINSSLKKAKHDNEKLLDAQKQSDLTVAKNRSEISELKAKIEILEETISEERKELSKEEDKNDENQADLELFNECESLKRSLSERDNQIVLLNNKIRTLDNSERISELERELEILTKSNINLTTQIDEWRAKYDSVSPELEKQTNENGELKIDLHRKDAVIKELRIKLNESCPDVKIGDEIRRLKEKLAQYEN